VRCEVCGAATIEPANLALLWSVGSFCPECWPVICVLVRWKAHVRDPNYLRLTTAADATFDSLIGKRQV
jgi:hypothetical protein